MKRKQQIKIQRNRKRIINRIKAFSLLSFAQSGLAYRVELVLL